MKTIDEYSEPIEGESATDDDDEHPRFERICLPWGFEERFCGWVFQNYFNKIYSLIFEKKLV